MSRASHIPSVLLCVLVCAGCGPRSIVPPDERATLSNHATDVTVTLDGAPVTDDRSFSVGQELPGRVTLAWHGPPSHPKSPAILVRCLFLAQARSTGNLITCGQDAGNARVENGRVTWKGDVSVPKQPGRYAYRVELRFVNASAEEEVHVIHDSEVDVVSAGGSAHDSRS